MTFTAICVKCGREMPATSAVEDGWILSLKRNGGYLVNACCWRCLRDRLVAGNQAPVFVDRGGA